jgi:AsmA protein
MGIITMTTLRVLRWIAGVLLLPVVLGIAFIAVVGWDWLRAPVERMVLDKTGRVLTIAGAIDVRFGWPEAAIHADSVNFANPAWAKEKQMIAAETVEITIDLPQLLGRNLVFPEVRLKRPVIFLEQGSDGKKNWLLDINQQDEAAQIRIGRVLLDQGTLGYDDVARKTHISAELTSPDTPSGTQSEGGDLVFSVQGKYKDLPLKARGQGGPVLALREEKTPYPVQADVTIGRTVVKVAGTVTSLLKLSAIDMQLAVRGESLAQLFPLLGIAFPETGAYATDGRLMHSGEMWWYEKFKGRIGESDIAGSLQVDTGSKRPALKAELVSRRLDFDDLGPLIGARPGRAKAAVQAAALSESASEPPASARPHVLPDMPFKTDRWDSVDAEVSLKATSIRAENLPLENLVTHLSLRDSVLKLDPLSFGVAGGQLNGTILLDGRQDPILARAQVRAKKIRLARLLPNAGLNSNSVGQINGEFDLSGSGRSVGGMLATANGKVGLVVVGGEVSQLMMERIGLHLWEILGLKVTGDKLVKLRCAVADFDAKRGVLNANALVFDTEVTTIIGTGSIDLGREELDLVLNQQTKNTSPLALRSPIHVRGSFARPDVTVDKGRVALRAFGAVALGLVNPLLALLPLIDAGPGGDSDCAKLVRDAQAAPNERSALSPPRAS